MAKVVVFVILKQLELLYNQYFFKYNFMSMPLTFIFIMMLLKTLLEVELSVYIGVYVCGLFSYLSMLYIGTHSWTLIIRFLRL